MGVKADCQKLLILFQPLHRTSKIGKKWQRSAIDLQHPARNWGWCAHVHFKPTFAHMFASRTVRALSIAFIVSLGCTALLAQPIDTTCVDQDIKDLFRKERKLIQPKVVIKKPSIILIP